MNLTENAMFEIGLLMENYEEMEKVDYIGHRVFEISLLLHEFKSAR